MKKKTASPAPPPPAAYVVHTLRAQAPDALPRVSCFQFLAAELKARGLVLTCGESTLVAAPAR